MRTLGEMIDEVRHNTNNPDDSRHSDTAIIRFFNTAQRQVHRLIFNADPNTKIVTRDYILTYSRNIIK